MIARSVQPTRLFQSIGTAITKARKGRTTPPTFILRCRRVTLENLIPDSGQCNRAKG